MSLVAHFPLTGILSNFIDTENPLVSAGTGNSAVSEGIFGKSYKNTTNTSGSLVTKYPIELGYTQSVFCWIYMTDVYSSSSLNAICGQHRYPSNCGMGLTVKYLSSTTGKLSVNTGDGTTRTYNTYTGSTVLSAGKWYHVGYTFNGATINLYVNGKLDGSYSDDHIRAMKIHRDYFGAFMWSFSSSIVDNSSVYSGYQMKGMINDIRLYNHVLSIEEIYSLSKGLYCHYSFDNWAPTNEFVTLMGNSIGTGGTLTQEGNNTFKLTSTTTATDTNHGLWLYWTRSDTGLLAANTSYVFSFEAFNASSSADIVVLPEAGTIVSSNYLNGGRVTCTVRNKWVKIYGVLITSASQSASAIMFYPNPYAGGFTDGYQLYRNITIYKGDEYIESAASLGLPQDNSGFRNVAINSTAVSSIDAAKGSGSAKFEGENFISCPTSVKLPGPMSYNIWAYMDDWSTYSTKGMRILSCTEGGGFNIEPDGSSGTGPNFNFALYDSKGGTDGAGAYVSMATTKTTASLSAGWHMFTMTFDGTYGKCYIDGVHLKTSAAFNGPIGYNSTNSLFLGAEAGTSPTDPVGSYFTGKLDDFKLYVTCLTNEDIQNEFNARGIISSAYAVTVSSFQENCSISHLNSKGVMETQEIVENKYFVASDGTKFLRIFHHDITHDSTMFGYVNEAKFSVSSNKETRLKDIPLFKDSSNNYEFLLRYPDLSYLPEGYQEVAYITATGTQYIKTGVIGTAATWEFDIKFNDTTTRQLMGYAGSGGQYWGVQADGGYGIYNSSSTYAGNVDKVIFDYINNKLIVNGTTVASPSGDITDKEYQIFALAGSYFCKASLYRCRVYANSVIIREFVPCYRANDGVVGLYDLVGRSFYTNAGSGSFTTGPAVKKQEHYIYNRWTQTANPLTTGNHNSQTASTMGYSAKELCWTSNFLYGMCLSAGTDSFMDCQAGKTNGNWYGAVGQYRWWSGGGFPAPDGTAQQHVELYIKVQDESDCSYIRKYAIPAAYQEVEYIQSSGTQLIDTNVTVNNDSDRYEIGFKPDDSTGNYFIAGSGWQENGKVWVYHYPSGNAFNLYITDTGGVQRLISGTKGTPAERYDVIYDAKNLYVNGMLTDSSATGYTFGSTPYTFTLFNSKNSSGYAAKTRIYYFKLYQSNICTRDMVPCYRKSDGVIGMYDKVNSVFYTNSGTGVFTKGTDINRTVIFMNEFKEI